MTSTLLDRILLALLTLAAVVLTADAAAGGQTDLAVLGGALVVLAIVLAARSSLGRPLLPLRADLARWLAREAAEGGEQTADVLDRAVAAYRDGLVGDVEADRARARRTR